MKQETHPTYHKTAKISCACGATFSAGSTRDEIRVEICSQCHPFYTGKQKLLDTAGRVDRFKMRMEASKKLQAAASKKAPKVETVETSDDK